MDIGFRGNGPTKKASQELCVWGDSKVSWIISAGSNISRVPNLLRLYLTQYCILSPEILTGQQEHKNVQEFVSISCHDAFVVNQEAFKHGE